MISKMVERDERTTFIENISYKFGYVFITFALLLDTAYRSLYSNEAPWDLLAIIIISGVVMSIYQYKQRILGNTWLRTFIFTFIIAFIIAIIMVFVRKLF
ncbi:MULTISPECIES: hypothetical protein [Dehalobacter]|uniref:Uncharacterized protein n=2 Tax=Dehalobacter restrictus TaxID=55583 RepID=A0A857DKN1_9FIRM|nr:MULTISPECIES: hypothetical protein [Dehalobacter]AHF10095.1 hypothetical protein DEHRE_08395 [Dehalobacter restrictus DSM 9455]MCG1025309.1 hypothetical protein [Dehalobacter sp.]MDJ0306162.1 hypothetical protein [Dehalobacter sp.]OCZ51999.1 hypothetical protein A7D23_11935 [Dehalobacter sp. TeCB1]QHA00696.1 hypothetical protein GQ588_08655 [Dehalobacter restrictus]